MARPTYKERYQQVVKFITKDIWHMDVDRYGRSKALGLHYLKVLLVTLKEFTSNRVGLQAAALTFFTLIALVPFVAIVFAITKGFGFAKELEELIYYNFSEQEDMVQWVLQFANNLLNTSKKGLFGIFGFVVFFWSVIWVMINVEQAFNRVWQVKNVHPIGRKILVYISLIILSPILIGSSFMIPLSYNNFMDKLGIKIHFISSLEPIVGWLLLFILVGALFFIAFKFIPNTRVRAMPALNAAIITTIAFVVVQILYVETQLFVSRLNAIYGAFAAIPLFMIWVHINWSMILFGAELSFAFQNIDRYEYEQAATHSNPLQRKLAALLIVRLVAQRFRDELPPLDMDNIATELELPSRLVHNMVQDLLACGVLAEVIDRQHYGEDVLIPAVDLHKLTILYIITRLEIYGEAHIVDSIRPDMAAILNALTEITQTAEQTEANKLIYEM